MILNDLTFIPDRFFFLPYFNRDALEIRTKTVQVDTLIHMTHPNATDELRSFRLSH